MSHSETASRQETVCDLNRHHSRATRKENRGKPLLNKEGTPGLCCVCQIRWPSPISSQKTIVMHEALSLIASCKLPFDDRVDPVWWVDMLSKS